MFLLSKSTSAFLFRTAFLTSFAVDFHQSYVKADVKGSLIYYLEDADSSVSELGDVKPAGTINA